MSFHHYLRRGLSIAASAFAALREGQVLWLDARVTPIPRYGYGRPPHPLLYDIINRHRMAYRALLHRFLSFREAVLDIPVVSADPREPSWRGGNIWIPALDALSLYALLQLIRPRRYCEIGSGYSTRFARRAIQDGRLSTEIISIDPHPRAEVEALCDRTIRRRLENVDLRLFDELDAGDILFVDGSHRCFMNSDVTVLFLDILPRLRSGVLVHFHDVFLPYDYPPQWGKRYYSEQYLLAVWLLAGSREVEIVLPNAFISRDPELSRILEPVWQESRMRGVNPQGASFWIRIVRTGGGDS
jgi:predicted O-methyltransferase YrrM